MILCTLLYSYVGVKNYWLSSITSDLVSSFPGVPPLIYAGSGVSKYDGMRWIRRYMRISCSPIITSMQLH